MTDAEYVQGRIRLLRPRAKFAAYSHSQDFISDEAELGKGFHYVNLYDENIDSNVIKTPRGLVLIHNTYLSSFAYNLFLCRLYTDRAPVEARDALTKSLLRHNFKKFFAEQLWHRNDNIFSRAILLETLLYEEGRMLPVFAAKESDSILDKRADFGANLMSSLLSFHELGHFFLRQGEAAWQEVLQSFPDTVGVLYAEAVAQYPPLFVVEFQCDTMAVLSALRQYSDENGAAFAMQTTAFAFAAYAVLSSLTKSAAATAESQRKVPDTMDFTSIEKKEADYTYLIGTDKDFVERARLMLRLCERLAQSQNIALFGDAAFPLNETIVDDLLLYLDWVMEVEEPHVRELSLLVGEGFHDHPQGMKYLYLRSKTFHSNREQPLKP